MICRMGSNFVEMGVEILRREMPGFIVNSRIQTISSKKTRFALSRICSRLCDFVCVYGGPLVNLTRNT